MPVWRSTHYPPITRPAPIVPGFGGGIASGGAALTIGTPIEDNVRAIADVVQVKSGHGVVIGGLIGANDTQSVSKVPVLGELFKFQLGAKSKTQLYIVVTPHIVQRGESDMAKAMSQK